IWGPTGIVLDWQRISSATVAATWRVTVTFDDGEEDVLEPPGALGWIPFTTDGPEPSIRLSRANAEAVIRGTPGAAGPASLRTEILIGRALGRALAHELGHYLLRSKAHTPRGLMRARWPVGELLSADRRGFRLTAEECAAASRARDDGGKGTG